MSRLQKKKDGVRLLADDGVTLCSLTKYTTSWILSCWIRDSDGRPLHGGVGGTTVADRAAGLAAIERIGPQLESMHAAHLETARRIGAAIEGPPDGTAAGEHERYLRRQNHALSISSIGRGTIETPAIALVRLLGAASRGDPQLASLLHKAVRVPASSDRPDDSTPELADALASVRSAGVRRELAERVGEAFGYPEEEALVERTVAALERLRTLSRQYDELVEAIGCGTNTAHETVVRKARDAAGGAP